METQENTLRSVARIVNAGYNQIGLFPVRTLALGRRAIEIDPFLQLEHVGPVGIFAGEDKSPDYLPHKGFEILTYLLEGDMKHVDSQGNYTILRSGDVQWIRAGRGILHTENSQKSSGGKGEIMHRVELWINLPGTKKLLSPTYQHISSFQLPTISLDNVIMKVLAGEWNGESSPVISQVPVLIMHLMMEAGAETEVNIPPSYQAGVYILKGYGLVGNEEMDAEEGSLVLFNNEGDNIRIKAPASKPLEVLLLSGEPIGEAIVSYGPFVMSNTDDVYEAMLEYTSGQLGTISMLDTKEP